jgi:ATP-dependent Clp protease ATP-binding subunit ClpA
MFERFTQPARDVVVRAEHEAIRLRHDCIGKEHLLLALSEETGGVAAAVLRELGVTHEAVEREVLRVEGLGPPSSLGPEDADALRAIGIDLDEVRRAIEESFGPGALDRTLPSCGTRIPFSSRAKESLQLAARSAKDLHHDHLGTEHVLLGLVRSEGGVGAEVLRGLNVSPAAVRARVLEKLDRAS